MYSIIPKQKSEGVEGDVETEWKPSMNLYELIQYIPEFISDHLLQQNVNNKQGFSNLVGKFYLGLNYDY